MLKKSARLLTAAIAISAVVATATPGFAAPTAGRTASGMDGQRIEFKRENYMESLVTQGLIDQATYESIQAYLESSRPSMDDRVEKMNRADQTNPVKGMLSDMLSEGIITQAEYDAILAAMPTPGERPDFKVADNGDRPAPGERPDFKAKGGEDGIVRKNPFEELGAQGTISQAAYDAITAYMESHQPVKPDKDIAEFEKTERKDLFTELLENGIITQTQYDAIKAAMPAPLENRTKEKEKADTTTAA